MTQSTARWDETELALTATAQPPANAYTDVAVHTDFTGPDGQTLRRPAFWDGGSTWRVRFAAPTAGRWQWRTTSNPPLPGLHDVTGAVDIADAASTDSLRRHGLLRMSPGGRSVVHADGTPFLVVGDTAWALPWRATVEQATIYAQDRQRKGFNAALLMTVQPDMKAVGPRDRTAPEGFDVGFEDLPTGRLARLNPAYFQTFDRLVDVLLAHGIVPVYQPVFHGYGWKGLDVAGKVVSCAEYARYCRYLVARYGAKPAIWLVGGDGDGTEPGVAPGGREIEQWDAYQQPTGIHYAPHRYANAHQGQPWLDFQWCQTGHAGEHLPERVAVMTHQLPAKAVANGEPTYERIGSVTKATGWWQGHEAWCNLCAGGTMGVVYGAGSLWQWKLSPDEPGHQDWCVAPGAGWREALDFEGSTCVGIVGCIFREANLPSTDMQPDWTCTYGGRNLLVPGKLFIRYLETGGGFQVIEARVPRHYRVIDPRTAHVVSRGQLPPEQPWTVNVDSGAPRVVVFTNTP